MAVGPVRDDIIEYLRVRLDEDETPGAMDESLAADIMEKIPENISEMYVGAGILKTFPTQFANKYASRFLLVSLNCNNPRSE